MTCYPLILALLGGLVGMGVAPGRPVRAFFVGAWSLLMVLLAPFGLFLGADFGPLGLLAFVVCFQGFFGGFLMWRLILRLRRNQPEGSGAFLLYHHVSVPLAFFLTELLTDRHHHLSSLCVGACAVGIVIVWPRLPERRPVQAF